MSNMHDGTHGDPFTPEAVEDTIARSQRTDAPATPSTTLVRALVGAYTLPPAADPVLASSRATLARRAAALEDGTRQPGGALMIPTDSRPLSAPYHTRSPYPERRHANHFPPFWRTAAAALIVALLGASFFMLLHTAPRPGGHPTPTAKPGAPTPTVAPLTWRQATLPDGFALPGSSTFDNGFAISPADGQRAWACAPVANRPGAFTLWTTHDAATTWQQVSTLAPQMAYTPQRCELNTDQYDPHTLIAAFGSGYCNTCRTPERWTAFLSTDDGATWQPAPGNVAIQEVATNNGTVYAIFVNQDQSSLVTITDTGGTMSVRQTGLPALAPNVQLGWIWMHPPDPALYASDSSGHLWRSDDRGAHWTSVGTSPGGGITPLGRWIETQHHWLFCTPTNGAVQCSDDGGQTWPSRLAQGIARGCSVGGITADGSLLVVCADDPNAARPSSLTLTLQAPGAVGSQPLGTVPGYRTMLTATGQIWGFNAAGDAVYVATFAG